MSDFEPQSRDLILVDGMVIDPETGEVLEGAPLNNPLNVYAGRLLAAKEQEAAWKFRKGIYSRMFIGQQEANRAVYGDIAVNCRRAVVNRWGTGGMADRASRYPSRGGLDKAELCELFAAVKVSSIDMKQLSPRLRGWVTDFRRQEPGAEYAFAERVAIEAPALEVVRRSA
jgi:hypothetical protein